MVLILITGVALLVYPSFSDWWNSLHQTRAVASYQEAVADLSGEERQAQWDAAAAYNAGLPAKGDRYHMSEEEQMEYENLLDISGTGIMGSIEIEKINVDLPIYHGTDEGVLQIALGHIPGSSLPVGGESAHAVISGHRGLPSARLFTDIDQLVNGDIFTLQVLGNTLTYEVDQISTVLPSEMENLEIEEGHDYVTLVTCTPYGVNTHRLLVRGHRIPNLQGEVNVSSDGVRIDPLVLIPVPAVILIVMIFISIAADQKKHRSRSAGKRNVRRRRRIQ